MSTTPEFIPFCEHVCDALALWVRLGAERLEDTDWKRVDLCAPDTWPSDKEIEDGSYYFTRSEVEELLRASDWLASAGKALKEHNNEKSNG